MKKIMFNDKYGLTKAVLEGRKTMTRRFAEKVLVEDENGFLCWNGEFKNPRYNPGEIVAVAQNLRDMGYNPRDTKHRPGEIWGLDHSAAWTNKMFVSASECIHKIRITNVRVEKLQDISEEDCMKEGVYVYQDEYGSHGFSFKQPNGDVALYITPIGAFAALIDKVSGKGTWDDNPFVFVYEFELLK